jgi:hypothetical protein
MDVLVHPDEEIFFVKQIVMEKATTDGKTINCFNSINELNGKYGN